MRVWIDTEVILDCLYEREGYEDSLMTLKICEAKMLDGCISAVTLVCISEKMKDQLSTGSTAAVANDIARILTVVDVGKKDFDFDTIGKFDSFAKGFDAVCTRNAGAKYIVTHDTEGYDGIEIVAIRPDEIGKIGEITCETMYVDPARC